jgi:N-acetylglucosaminyldiphosphoundecaprenol N-acetyl-beta-D-mannosaminyltransferase
MNYQKIDQSLKQNKSKLKRQKKLEIPKKSTAQILNVDFDRVTSPEAVESAMHLIQKNKRGYICTVNVAILMMMRSNPRLEKFVQEAALVVADGQPIVWLSRWLKNPLPERVTGVDLIEALAKRCEEEGVGVYLLGSTSEAIAQTASKLRYKYPKIRICGFSNGYFSDLQAQERVKAIHTSGAQVLFVGMGVPRQEFFLEENWSELGVSLAIGVGGSFEVFAGRKKRAPFWMQQTGLEWLYRLLQEPRRLGKRYLVTNLQFINELLPLIWRRFGQKSP